MEGGQVTPDHWEEELKGSAVDPQGGQAGSGNESPSEQSEETVF